MRARTLVSIVVTGMVMAMAAASPPPAPMAHAQALRAAASGTWALTGTLATARTYHTATLLPDGDVLVAGGMDDSGAFLASAELYHPQTGSWSPTGAMSISRTFHTATLLPTGQVLVAGGLTIVNGQETVVASAELYTPATGSWSPTGAMSTSREFHTATLLQNGQVLVAGGASNDAGGGALRSAEVYNPNTGKWRATGEMGTGRNTQLATLLATGQVLVSGGYDTSGHSLFTAEVYTPSTGTWAATGPMMTSSGGSAAPLLPTGQVLLANPLSPPVGEVYDPRSNAWTPTRPMGLSRFEHTVTLLATGKVLVAGGCIQLCGPKTTSAELYAPLSRTWTATGSLSVARAYHTATLLQNGQVLVAGGGTATAELYTP